MLSTSLHNYSIGSLRNFLQIIGFEKYRKIIYNSNSVIKIKNRIKNILNWIYLAVK